MRLCWHADGEIIVAVARSAAVREEPKLGVPLMPCDTPGLLDYRRMAMAYSLAAEPYTTVMALVLAMPDAPDGTPTAEYRRNHRR